MIAKSPYTLAEQLAEAERHVRDGEIRISLQRAHVHHLECIGCDTTESRLLLAELEKSQRLFIADRDRLKAECAGVWSDTPAARRSQS